MDMWSPLYVAQPRASSERSPVPMTRAPSLLATSIRTWVLSLACPFSKVTERSSMLCPISLKWLLTLSPISMVLKSTPSVSASFSALLFVLPVVPKQGIVMATMPFLSKASMSKALTATNRARVLSRPPESPTTTFLLLVWESLLLSPRAWRARIFSHLSLLLSSSEGTKGWGSIGRVRRVSSSSNSMSM